jgi:hypothetical protein
VATPAAPATFIEASVRRHHPPASVCARRRRVPRRAPRPLRRWPHRSPPRAGTEGSVAGEEDTDQRQAIGDAPGGAAQPAPALDDGHEIHPDRGLGSEHVPAHGGSPPTRSPTSSSTSCSGRASPRRESLVRTRPAPVRGGRPGLAPGSAPGSRARCRRPDVARRGTTLPGDPAWTAGVRRRRGHRPGCVRPAAGVLRRRHQVLLLTASIDAALLPIEPAHAVRPRRGRPPGLSHGGAAVTVS